VSGGRKADNTTVVRLLGTCGLRDCVVYLIVRDGSELEIR